MEGLVSPVLFWIIAAVLVLSALAMVMSKNIVHSALWLVLAFLGVAGVFFMLEADFLAAVQLLVYAGAVSILLVFGVMLTRRSDMKNSNLFNGYKTTGAVVAAILLVLIGNLVLRSAWIISPAAKQAQQSTVEQIADLLLGKFVVPFEVAALLLLVAMVGAIILARGVKQGS